MGDGSAAAIVVLGIFTALFVAPGIAFTVTYFRLKHGDNAVAEVTEHLLEESRTDRGKRHYTWMLKLKYSVNGVEYEKRYSVVKPREYIEAHPVGTAVKILVVPNNPKRFIMPEDLKNALIPGIFFSIGGAACLAGFFSLLIK